MSNKKDVSKGTFNYFKVADKLLDTDIKKSELWVYLTHCRHRGSRTKGYSIAGLNAVQNHFGNKIKKKTYNKTIESLEKKELISIESAKENGIQTMYYKTDDIAIKILKDKSEIQLPIDLLDKKIITNLGVEEIKDIIRLYNLYDPIESHGGLNYEDIKAVDSYSTHGVDYLTNFGGGFSATIKGKRAYKVNDPTKYIISNEDIKNIYIDKYVDMNLFRIKPVVYEVDPEDESLAEIVREIFSDLVGFSNDKYNYKYITVLKENQKVISVLEPIYPVRNEEYTQYIKEKGKAKKRAIAIYSQHDDSTREEVRKRIIESDQLENFILTYAGNRADIPTDEIYDLLQDRSEVKIHYINKDDIYTEITLLEEEIKNEKLYIEDENIRVTAEENLPRKRRHTTSARLKQLIKELEELEEIIYSLNEIDNSIINITPNWIFKIILEAEQKYLEI